MIEWDDSDTHLHTWDNSIGTDDWRLPTVEELTSLIDYSCAEPACSQLALSPLATFWTATTLTSLETHAWTVNFKFGTVSYSSKQSRHYTVLIRHYSCDTWWKRDL